MSELCNQIPSALPKSRERRGIVSINQRIIVSYKCQKHKHIIICPAVGSRRPFSSSTLFDSFCFARQVREIWKRFVLLEDTRRLISVRVDLDDWSDRGTVVKSKCKSAQRRRPREGRPKPSVKRSQTPALRHRLLQFSFPPGAPIHTRPRRTRRNARTGLWKWATDEPNYIISHLISLKLLTWWYLGFFVLIW